MRRTPLDLLVALAALAALASGRALFAQANDVFSNEGGNLPPMNGNGGNGGGGDTGLFGDDGKGDPKDDPFANGSGEKEAEMLDPFSNAAPKNENSAKGKKAPKAGEKPKNAAPGNGVDAVPINGLPADPTYDVPQNAVPKNAAPKNAAPKNAAPKNAAPGNGAPKNAAPKNAAPKNAAPAEAAPKNEAKAPAKPEEAPWEPIRPRPVIPRAKQPFSRIGEDALKATATKPHAGILGLAWGKTPAEARAILGPKLRFIEEKPAHEEVYHTLDQRYEGDFAGLPTADIFLRFYKGKFFYMMVTLATRDAGSATRVFEDSRAKMRAAYGPGRGYKAPIRLASRKAILEHLPLDEQTKKNGLPMLWNEAKEQNPMATFRLRDLYIRSHFWDPFEGWRFPNGVVIQTFVFEQFYKDHVGGTLKPLWIFCKKDVFDLWKREIVAATIVEPRDF